MLKAGLVASAVIVSLLVLVLEIFLLELQLAKSLNKLQVNHEVENYILPCEKSICI